MKKLKFYICKILKILSLLMSIITFISIYIMLKSYSLNNLILSNYKQEETVTCYGYDEFGEKIYFDATKETCLGKERYILKDTKRNIEIFESKSLLKTLIPNIKNKIYFGPNTIITCEGIMEIESNTPEFNNPIAIKAYKNMQIVYDWYKENFNLLSYDNKNTKINLYNNSNVLNYRDNAAFLKKTNIFFIFPAEIFKYSFSSYLTTLGHEYTHAIFNEHCKYEGNVELDGINEAYADVFACLIEKNSKWLIGENYLKDGTYIIGRDIKNINTEYSIRDFKYPTTYKGENWEEEKHIISIILSHIGYEMYTSNLFTSEDVAKIWYESLCLGYKKDSTFYDIRLNLLKAAKNLGYNQECQDFIANNFDLIEIPNFSVNTSYN